MNEVITISVRLNIIVFFCDKKITSLFLFLVQVYFWISHMILFFEFLDQIRQNYYKMFYITLFSNEKRKFILGRFLSLLLVFPCDFSGICFSLFIILWHIHHSVEFFLFFIPVLFRNKTGILFLFPKRQKTSLFVEGFMLRDLIYSEKREMRNHTSMRMKSERNQSNYSLFRNWGFVKREKSSDGI